MIKMTGLILSMPGCLKSNFKKYHYFKGSAPLKSTPKIKLSIFIRNRSKRGFLKSKNNILVSHFREEELRELPI